MPGARLEHRVQMSFEVAVQMPFITVAGDQTGACPPSEGMRYRRPLRTDQPSQKVMGQREREPDAARLDLSPTRRQVPQQQGKTNLQPGMGGDRTLDVQIACALGCPP